MILTPCVFFLLCTYCFGVDSRALDKKNTDIQHTSQVARDEDMIIFREEKSKETDLMKILPEDPDDFENRFGVRVGKCIRGYVRRGSRCVPA